MYDDFAHHPTEIAATLSALRRRAGLARIIAIFEPRTQTMRLGLYAGALADAFHDADLSFLYSPPDLSWDIAAETVALGTRGSVCGDIAEIVTQVADLARPGDQVVVMSNGVSGSSGAAHRRPELGEIVNFFHSAPCPIMRPWHG